MSTHLTCPACGQPIVRTDNQCLSCGAHLDEGQLVGAPTGEAPPPAAAQPSPAPLPPAAARPVADDVLDVELEPQAPTAPRGPVSPPAGLPYYAAPGSPVWSESNLPRGQVLWASLSRAWAFLKESLALAERDSVVVAPSLIATGLGLLLVAACVVLLILPAHHVGSGPRSVSGPVFNLLWAGVGFVGLLVSYWFMGMTTDLVSALLKRQPATLSHAWGEACRNGLALMWLALITMLVNALSAGARRRGGFVGDMAADAVQTGWRVASHLLVPIIILEDIPLSQAYSRAVQLHKNNVIGIIVGEIGVSWLTGTICSVVFFGLLLGGFFAYHAAPTVLPVYIASAVGIFVVLVSAANYVRIAYYTCLYEWAAAEEAAGEPVPAPAPLAAALGLA